jgi:hypothetical protein
MMLLGFFLPLGCVLWALREFTRHGGAQPHVAEPPGARREGARG